MYLRRLGSSLFFLYVSIKIERFINRILYNRNMKRLELVYREILYRVIEGKERRFTQSELSKNLGISLSIVNAAVRKLHDLGAIKVLARSFEIVDIRKILYYWASVRNFWKDVVYKIRVEMPVREIERNMPSGIFYTAYSAYKFEFKDVPADYSEVYVYANDSELELIKKRFNRFEKNKLKPNLFVLRKDSLMDKYKSILIAQIFVDLWNLGEWYSKDFVNAIEKKIENKLENM